jgi:hypothetical protein
MQLWSFLFGGSNPLAFQLGIPQKFIGTGYWLSFGVVFVITLGVCGSVVKHLASAFNMSSESPYSSEGEEA